MTLTLNVDQAILTSVPMTDPHFDRTRWHDRNSVHKAIMALFPTLPNPARSHANILFRIEPEHTRALIQSTVAPANATAVTSRPLAPVFDQYSPGTRITLLADINAVRTVNRTHSGHERTHRAQCDLDTIPAWLADRTADALNQFDIVDLHRTYTTMRDTKLVVDRVRAHATITDPDRFRHHVIVGIGRAKAYGCGLISALPL